MTTKKKLLFQCKRLLSSGTTPKDSNLNDAYIKTEIIQVTNSLLKIDYYNSKDASGKLQSVNPVCIATYSSVAVANDTTFKRNYSLLPAYAMNVRDSDGNNVGVQQVRPQTGLPVKDVAMIPIQPHEYELFKSLLVGAELLKDQFTFEVDRNKVWYSKKSDKTLLESSITAVEMKIVVYDPSTIDDDDNYPVPPEMEFEIVKSVLLLHGYQPQKAEDLINNDNQNQ